MMQAGSEAVVSVRTLLRRRFFDPDDKMRIVKSVVLRVHELAKTERAQDLGVEGQ